MTHYYTIVLFISLNILIAAISLNMRDTNQYEFIDAHEENIKSSYNHCSQKIENFQYYSLFRESMNVSIVSKESCADKMLRSQKLQDVKVRIVTKDNKTLQFESKRAVYSERDSKWILLGSEVKSKCFPKSVLTMQIDGQRATVTAPGGVYIDFLNPQDGLCVL